MTKCVRSVFIRLATGALLGAVALVVACTSNTTGPAATPANQEIIVFAAASLTDAFTEIAEQFEAQHPGTAVTLNFAGSSHLATQLVEGGQADIFASANEKQLQAVVDIGRVTANTAVPFASNRLTIVVPADNPAGIGRLEDLDRPGILLVLAAPGVPVRQYTDEIVAQLGPDFAAGFYANLVSEEDNVRQVLAKVALGEADAGIVYTSDVRPEDANQVQQILIPAAKNVIARYPMALVADAPHPELGQQFLDFVLAQEGQAILARWGFGPR